MRFCPRCGAAIVPDELAGGRVLAARGPQPAPSVPYPVTFEVEYPEQQSRWKTLLRIPLVIPVWLFSYLLVYVAFLALFPVWVAALLRGRMPRFLFDFLVATNRFFVRVQAYASLLTDVYPAFEGEYPVRYWVRYPQRISRWKLVFWKFATSIPHLIVLQVLLYAVFAVVAIGWLAIMFTGAFPRALHDFVVNVTRYQQRAYAYILSLRDEYPPYSLDRTAGRAGTRAYAISAVAGLAFGSAAVAGCVALIVVAPGQDRIVREVSYARVLEGQLGYGETQIEVGPALIELVDATDPADELVPLIQPAPGHRLVQFSLFVTSLSNSDEGLYLSGRDFDLTDAAGDDRDPALTLFDEQSLPVELSRGEMVIVDVVFALPLGVIPHELSFRPFFDFLFGADEAVYRFTP